MARTTSSSRKHHTDTSEYDLPGRKITLQRAEARLVARYRNTLSDPQAWRLRLDVGWTDLFDPARADLIERSAQPPIDMSARRWVSCSTMPPTHPARSSA